MLGVCVSACVRGAALGGGVRLLSEGLGLGCAVVRLWSLGCRGLGWGVRRASGHALASAALPARSLGSRRSPAERPLVTIRDWQFKVCDPILGGRQYRRFRSTRL